MVQGVGFCLRWPTGYPCDRSSSDQHHQRCCEVHFLEAVNLWKEIHQEQRDTINFQQNHHPAILQLVSDLDADQL